MTNPMKKYRARIVREGVLKSLFIALAAGSGTLALCALLSWFFGFTAGLFVGIGLFVLVTAALTPTIYFAKYRPSVKAVAARVDALGLEERILTMTQLEGDDSYIARMQRQDAQRALEKADHMTLKIAVSAGLCVLLSFALAFGLSGATVGSLYNAGVIPSGMQLIAKNKPVTTITLSYSAQENSGGAICLWDEDWEEPELLEDGVSYELHEGEEAPAVYALDGTNATFIGWSDGVATRYRKDVASKSANIVALYSTVMFEEPPRDDQIMSDTSDNNNDNQDGPTPNQDGPNKPGDLPNPDATGGGSGGKTSDSKQIVDGSTYYGDRFEDAYGDALDRLGSDDGISDELKGWISEYYDSIRKGESGSDDGETNP